MDSTRFDAVARRLATANSRRLLLQLGAAGLVALLGETAPGSDVEGAGRKQKQKEQKREHDRKERRREERRERKEERREDRKDTCAANEKQCGDACIGTDRCCTKDECTGEAAGQCVSNTCEPAFQTCTAEDGRVSFVATAPGNPPKSKGAVKFTIGAFNAVTDWAHLRNADFAGLPITAIQKLEYSVYAEPLVNASCPTFSPYMALYTAQGVDNHILVAVPERTPPVCSAWQTIDAATQKWWMPFAPDFADLQHPKTLAEIEDEFPGMTTRNAVTTDSQCSTALGGLRLEYGEFPGGGGTGDAVAYVSYLTVEIGDKKETFLF